MIRVLSLGSFLMLAACGMPTPVKCTAANCSGCCTDEGECLVSMKQSRQACGAMGGACRVCLPQQLCGAGACVRDPDASVIIDDAGTTVVADAGADGGVSCGARLQPCCAAGQSCFLTLSCQRGVCDVSAVPDAGPCGALGQVCCANQVCTGAGTACNGVTCITPAPPDGGGGSPDAGQDAGGSLKATGEACALDRDCLDGACLSFGFNGGYCTRSCTTSVDCVAGSQCGVNPSGVGPAKVCLKQCASPGQAPGGCRATYVCEANGGTSGVPVCFPGCTSSTMCGLAPTCDSRGFCCGGTGFVCCEGSTCQSGNTCMAGTCRASAACGSAGQPCCTSGTACLGQTACQANSCAACGGLNQPCCASNVCSQGTCTSGTCQSATATGAVGDPCASFTSCAGNTCLMGGNYTGGYCSSSSCTASSCPAGSSCSAYLLSGNSYCLKDCQWDGGAGGCRSGYVCDRYLIAGPPNPNPAATCIAACSGNADCTTGTCRNGFCCGGAFYRCCGTTCAAGRTCTNGYCL